MAKQVNAVNIPPSDKIKWAVILSDVGDKALRPLNSIAQTGTRFGTVLFAAEVTDGIPFPEMKIVDDKGSVIVMKIPSHYVSYILGLEEARIPIGF